MAGAKVHALPWFGSFHSRCTCTFDDHHKTYPIPQCVWYNANAEIQCGGRGSKKYYQLQNFTKSPSFGIWSRVGEESLNPSKSPQNTHSHSHSLSSPSNTSECYMNIPSAFTRLRYRTSYTFWVHKLSIHIIFWRNTCGLKIDIKFQSELSDKCTRHPATYSTTL